METIIINLKNKFKNYIFIDISKYDFLKQFEYINKQIMNNNKKVILISDEVELFFIFTKQNKDEFKFSKNRIFLFINSQVYGSDKKNFNYTAIYKMLDDENMKCLICFNDLKKSINCMKCTSEYCDECFYRIDNCSICKTQLHTIWV